MQSGKKWYLFRIFEKKRNLAEPKILVTINAGHGQENLGGCPEWNCKLTYDRGMLDKADAVLIAHDDAGFKQRPDQYVIYFSQVSFLIMNMILIKYYGVLMPTFAFSNNNKS